MIKIITRAGLMLIGFAAAWGVLKQFERWIEKERMEQLAYTRLNNAYREQSSQYQQGGMWQ